MPRHYFTAVGLGRSRNKFEGDCVAEDIIDAINLFRNEDYSVHSIEQQEQAHADHACGITYLTTQRWSQIYSNQKQARHFKTDSGVEKED